MSKIKLLSVDFSSQWFAMHDDTTLFGEIVSTPDVMITYKKMHLYTHIC